ncbi:MAG: ATP-grasp domain-containing protein, partial [Candidatus Ozemobacteraceae bacterium]
MNNSNKKTLLVLAASLNQIDTIRTARRLGYRVVTTDNRPENPGHALADRAYGADTCDIDAVLAIARDEHIAGVLAPCTDIAMPAAAAVADELGLPGPPPDSTGVVCDKARFRDFQVENRLSHPRYRRLDSVAGLPEFDNVRRWVVKPCQSSGSKGIRVVSSIEELREALPAAFGFSKSTGVIVEEFLSGHQGTCEGWLCGGEIVWNCLLDRQTVSLPFVATCGHYVPTILSPTDQARVIKAIGEVWRRLRVADGPFDCDFVVNTEAVFILELSPRLGGNGISQLVHLAFGFDLVEHTVRWACRDNLG